MSCDDGQGLFIGMTVTKDYRCLAAADIGDDVVAVQALIRLHTEDLTTSTVLKVKSAGEWRSEVEVFESPSAEDGCGALMRMRRGCIRSNSSWTTAIEYNGEWAIEKLIGIEGTLRRTSPDGTYREGTGWCLGGTIFPSQVPNEESVGELTWQWQGGSVLAVKAYDSADTEIFDGVIPP